ncbi:hypothetical protein P3X46_012258 [Hevea brasiliensis]|uniref:HTH myb-type domain-containing protein n=1 Tax=Hevea brasiliensis TaxID=3981 RepID=A0ABQ9M9N3_HEVBR|nr:hypothetical protein P3X46_012258 [Hevea brasiliensis]
MVQDQQATRRDSDCGGNGRNPRRPNGNDYLKLFGVNIMEKQKQPIIEEGITALGTEFSQQGSTSRRQENGKPWTEEEHQMFLKGLKELGKGKWREISEMFVKTRTTTQVASHAQKHFLRQTSTDSRRSRRKPSIFDTPLKDSSRFHLDQHLPPYITSESQHMPIYPYIVQLSLSKIYSVVHNNNLKCEKVSYAQTFNNSPSLLSTFPCPFQLLFLLKIHKLNTSIPISITTKNSLHAFVGERTDFLSNVISATVVRRMMRKGCEAYLAHVVDTRQAKPNLSGIPTVRDFLSISEELQFATRKEVEFAIETLRCSTYFHCSL